MKVEFDMCVSLDVTHRRKSSLMIRCSRTKLSSLQSIFRHGYRNRARRSIFSRDEESSSMGKVKPDFLIGRTVFSSLGKKFSAPISDENGRSSLFSLLLSLSLSPFAVRVVSFPSSSVLICSEGKEILLHRLVLETHWHL